MIELDEYWKKLIFESEVNAEVDLAGEIEGEPWIYAIN